ncbi:MAG: hypothetical protein CMH70_09050 [Nitrosomonadaceae bacterium]|nr:hypothetical protein [Nitrosomonadaceae bacterium]|tara:strand:+ start:114 stop:722 length:609 start_codon:yes stop_codon:yes gene_type:complete
MNQLQKNLVDSTTSIRTQAYKRTEKSIFLSYYHRSIIIKYLLKYIFKIKALNLLRFKFNNQRTTHSLRGNRAPQFKPKILSCSPTCPSILNKAQTNRPDISNKYVLCIGGRGKLYPEYRCLIESLGGKLLIYRGNQKGDTDRLPDLLTCADMVICPIDCVNHETYFAVKHFCKKSGKPCALLDHCDLTTFGKGIETLAGAAA